MEGTQQYMIDVPKVAISAEGIFKYILIIAKVENGKNKKELYFVRGDKKLEYHAQNFQAFANQLKSKGYAILNKSPKTAIQNGKFKVSKGNVNITLQCPGGGRIQHNYKGHKCFIYGYSKSYGKVDHHKAQQLISANLKYSLEEIKTSQQGY